jgi:hypothetical protein
VIFLKRMNDKNITGMVSGSYFCAVFWVVQQLKTQLNEEQESSSQVNLLDIKTGVDTS